MPEIVTERLKIKPDARTANRQAEEVNSQAEKSCAPTAGDSDKVPSQLGDGEHKDTAGPTDTATMPGKRELNNFLHVTFSGEKSVIGTRFFQSPESESQSLISNTVSADTESRSDT